MVPTVAFLVATAAYAGTPASPQAGIFIAACLDGKVALGPGELTRIDFSQLPSVLRKRLGKPSSAQIWQVNSPGRNYLYVLNYPTRPKVDPKVCGFASDTMALDEAADALQMRVAGNVYRARGQSIQLLMPKDGYVAISTTAGMFSILQVNWMNDADRAAVQKNFHAVTP